MSVYHPLTLEEAVAHARRHTDLFASDASLTCREIGDGNLNLVFHVLDESNGQSVILKQALPYAKVVGESWPLTLDRARIESEALILQGRLCPSLTPKVYAYVPELALTVMEDLSDHVIMRKGLIEGNRYPLFARHIGEFMARTLFFTSDLGMNQQEKKGLVKSFVNPELCKITEDLIFDDPYRDSPNNDINPAIRDAVEAVWADHELHFEVALLRQKFLTEAQALLHGDLHTGSIFVTADSTKVIDPEFAYYGPMGFDIGAVLANLMLNYAGQEGWIDDPEARREFREYLLTTARDVWNEFAERFSRLWDEHAIDPLAKVPGYQDHYIHQLLQDAVGFAGCKIVRRIHGLSHVADIYTIPDPARRERAERLALAIGTRSVKQHRTFDAIEQWLELVRTCEA